MSIFRILFITANPTEAARLNIDEELRQIKNRIRSSDLRESFEIELAPAVRPRELLEYLNQHRPHIVHFSGHGSERGEILLLDDAGRIMPIPADVLSKVFATVNDNVRMVVLNACYSEIQAKGINQAVDYVIGMNGEIGDEAAITFSSALYSALGYNRTIRGAFDQAITGLLLENIREESIPKLLVKHGVSADTTLTGSILEPNAPDGAGAVLPTSPTTAASRLFRLVEDLRRRRLSVSLVGVLVLISAVISTYRIDPQNIQGQIAGGAIGVIIIIFGQLFYFLDRIPLRDRAKVVLGMFIICTVLILALTAFTVQTLRDALIAIEPPHAIDLRTSLDANHSENERLQANAVLTVPFLYRSKIQPSKVAIIEIEKAEIKFPKEVIEFRWRHFVRQNGENGKWLGIDEDAGKVAIRPGETVRHETLLVSDKAISWKDVVAVLDDPVRETLLVDIKAVVGDSTVTSECKADLGQYRKNALKFRLKNTTQRFMYATISCI